MSVIIYNSEVMYVKKVLIRILSVALCLLVACSPLTVVAGAGNSGAYPDGVTADDAQNAIAGTDKLLANMFPLVKQHGALLAKGRLLGVQFSALFRDGLYERIGAHAVALALRIRRTFERCGYRAVVASPTNQQFFELDNAFIDNLHNHVSFDYWGPRGAERSCVRFVTSWATRTEDVDELCRLIEHYAELR